MSLLIKPKTLNSYNCFHCDLSFTYTPHQLDEKVFCCRGCKTVYQLIKNKQLATFYELVPGAGNIPTKENDDYAILALPDFAPQFISFEKENSTQASFSVPSIHCSACIWILEQLNQFNPSIYHSTVNFSEKSIRFVFNNQQTNLRSIATLLASLGYPPDISLGHANQKKEYNNRLLQQMGVAGFAFGNCMFLSLSTYFESQEFWIIQFRPWFDVVAFLMSLPVVLFSAQDYFRSAWKGLKLRTLTLNIPIALGITVLFLKSVSAVFLTDQLGYFDSLTGLVFFLLIGKFMQEKIYKRFSYDRDYTSFFPMGIHKVHDNRQTLVSIETLKKGDQIAIRVGELIPVDCVLTSKKIALDYSFVTGESKVIHEEKGAVLFAGGKVLSQNGLSTVKRSVEESNLIQLWKEAAFQTHPTKKNHSITDQFSHYFTPFILLFATLVGLCWAFIAPERILDIFTAVLIVACPCALALSAPFVFGNMLRYFDKLSFYPRATEVLEKITQITHVVFDKTGTLTNPGDYIISFVGTPLNLQEKKAVKSICYQSNHPLSIALFTYLSSIDFDHFIHCTHHMGEGLEAIYKRQEIKIGSASFVKFQTPLEQQYSVVHLSFDGVHRGYFVLQPSYRPKLKSLFKHLNRYSITILSGDTVASQEDMKKHIPAKTHLCFDQNPFQKIDYIKKLQKKGEKVLMIGDGLNDAGALQQSDVGIAIKNQTHAFTPACDAILFGKDLHKLGTFIQACQNSKRLIYLSFTFSLFYNLIGLSIATLGFLSPLIAAILMPLSSISVVLFAYGSTYLLSLEIKKRLKS